MIIQIRCVFFFNDTATTEIYTLSLHDALPISQGRELLVEQPAPLPEVAAGEPVVAVPPADAHAQRQASTGDLLHRGRLLRQRSEEHTSELQSRQYLVCRLLLEKKKQNNHNATI